MTVNRPRGKPESSWESYRHWSLRALGDPEREPKPRTAFRRNPIKPGVPSDSRAEPKNHDSEGLRSWLARALASDIPELKGFVTGIERDYDAVNAAVTQAWSNGQVEGQVHRIKLLKRQMYGRSGFALLRRRVLPLHANSPGGSP